MSTQSFGYRVREIRLARGLSQSQLAAAVAARTRSRITKSLVSQWEVGRVTDPKLKTVLALQDALQVPVEWLVTGHGPSDLPAAALEAGGKVDIPRLERALSLALALDLGGSAETAEAAVLLYEFLKTSSSVNDEMLLAVARLGRSAR